MPTYSAQQRADAMRRAGFPESTIAQGTAISLAELGEQSDTNKVYGDNGESVGTWQIHLPAHPDVTTACAADLDCATRAAFRISSGGTNWNPWGAFTNGSWKKYLPFTSTIGPNGVSTPRPADAQITEGDTDPVIATMAPTEGGTGTTTGNPLTDFKLPSIDLGPPGVSLAGGALLKLAATFIAVGLVFIGILKLVGGEIDAGPVKVGK